MRPKTLTAVILAVLLTLAVSVPFFVSAQDATEEPPVGAGGAAILEDASGNQVGQVVFTERPDGKVFIAAVVNSLPPGFHGMHVHAVGNCEPAGDPPFSAAGEHMDTAGGTHPNHAGDLPSIYVNQDGTGELMFATDRLTLADLFDADGSAILIHANMDNFANIPADRYDPDPDATTLADGDSGPRIACGLIAEAATAMG